MLSISSLETLFTKARSHKVWKEKDITTEQIHQIYDLLKLALLLLLTLVPLGSHLYKVKRLKKD